MNAAKLKKLAKLEEKQRNLGIFCPKYLPKNVRNTVFCPNSMSEIQMSETFDNVRSETKEAPLVGRTTKSVLISSK